MLKLKMKRGDGRPGVYFHSAKGKREEGHSEGLVQVQGGVGGSHPKLTPSSRHSEYHGDDVQGAQVGMGLLPASLLVLLYVPKELKERWTPAPYPNLSTCNASRPASNSVSLQWYSLSPHLRSHCPLSAFLYYCCHKSETVTPVLYSLITVLDRDGFIPSSKNLSLGTGGGLVQVENLM